MSQSYDVYLKAARKATSWELEHDMLENGIIVHHVPKETTKAEMLIKDITYYARQSGMKTHVAWLDDWTVKITWNK